ncbi:MAG: dipeptide ABC transporter ATP-binding protein [Pseudomonadota bacterium]
MHELLRVEDLSVAFNLPSGRLIAVDGISFRIPRGRIVALVGESGSGKSVTGQAIMGLLPRNADILGGRILFDHDEDEATPRIDLAALPRDGRQMQGLRGRYMSIIFQEPMSALSPLHRIGSQISEVLRQHTPLSPGERQKSTLEMLRLTGFSDPARACKAYPFELSGGMRQRVMIAMALICRPSLVIADEPTTALDVTIQAQILRLLQNLQQQLRMAVLMITHDLGVVANIADEVVVMHRGRVMEAGCREDIFRRPGHPYLRGLLAAARQLTAPAAEKTAPGAGGEPLLEVRNVSKHYRGAANEHPAVEDVSFTIPRGACVALVGESGCGKTTLGKLVLRALTPDSGRILFAGQDVAGLKGLALRDYRARAQFIFQDPLSSLNPRMTVLETLREPMIIHGFGGREAQTERARELMRLVGLDPAHLMRYPLSFSGGQRQRIVIARALALRPELLICDEPVSALDLSIQAQILSLLKDLRTRLGLSYLFISHDLAVVQAIADHILVMCRGRLVETAFATSLFNRPVHPYTKALLAAAPKPDIGALLDFQQLDEERLKEPQFWPMPFTLTAGESGRMEEIAPDHRVRVGRVFA